MSTLDQRAESAAATRRPAGWYVDPQNLHHQRFYDGNAWTEHVTHFGPVPCSHCAR